MQKNANDETLSITYGTQKCRNVESSKFATKFLLQRSSSGPMK